MTDGSFTARDVARILKVPERRLRDCVRAAGLARGPTAQRFSFEQVLLLKTARGLLDARIPPARIRRILDSLRRQLPEDRGLSSVTIYADGRRVVVWDGTARWQPDSGQFLFNFAPAAIADEVALPLRRVRGEPPRSADDWLAVAVELERDSPEEARQAYEEALRMAPTCVEARINLGRLYHEAGDLGQAEACYRAALATAPNDAVAHFNLGVVLEAHGQTTAAIEEFSAAIRDDPALRDAHHNLALLCETEGRRADAIRHWQIVRALDRGREGRRTTRLSYYRKKCTPGPDSR